MYGGMLDNAKAALDGGTDKAEALAGDDVPVTAELIDSGTVVNDLVRYTKGASLLVLQHRALSRQIRRNGHFRQRRVDLISFILNELVMAIGLPLSCVEPQSRMAAKEAEMTTTQLAGVVESTAIRPFQVNVPEADLADLCSAHRGDPVARERNRRRFFAGRNSLSFKRSLGIGRPSTTGARSSRN